MSMKGSLKVTGLLLLAIELYGKKWKKVEEFVGTRTGVQIRSHAQKYFNKLNKLQNEQKKERKLSNLNNSKMEVVSENDLKGHALEEHKGKQMEDTKIKPINETSQRAVKDIKENDTNAIPLGKPQAETTVGANKEVKEAKEEVKKGVVHGAVNGVDKINNALIPKDPVEFKELGISKMKEIKTTQESVPLLSDSELHMELLRHTETIASFKRVFKALRLNYNSDPLAEIELTQGGELLDLMLSKVQQQFAVQRESAELHKRKDELVESIQEVLSVVAELQLKFGNQRFFTPFFERIKLKNGRLMLGDSAFQKLSEEARGSKCAEENGQQASFTISENAERRIDGLRERLGKK
eukprot:TRINITY_DN1541_c0_g1_i6.p1 TRINITY_DN1541_c0_g1~~TRINITY_DN1541_c0_g1_i6.p1  ORF type:complete len:353 (+),score=93.35 TRINITY_DN1541_c0_g1_i6:416-1474(+)